MSLRRLFRSGGGSFTAIPTPTPTPAVSGTLAKLPTTELAFFNSAEAMRAANEWNPDFTGASVVSAATMSALVTAYNNAAANTFTKIGLTGAAAAYAASDVAFGDKDFGSGGLLIDFGGVEVEANLILGHIHGLKMANGSLTKASQVAIAGQSVLGTGSASRGRKLRFTNMNIGRGFHAGVTETDWQTYASAGVSIFHAEQVHLESCNFNGISYVIGAHGTDLFTMTSCDYQQYIQTIYSHSSAYNPGETKAPALGDATRRLAFLRNNTARNQWDRMDLWQVVNGTGAPHVDWSQANPPLLYNLAIGATRQTNERAVTSTGRIYICTVAGGGTIAGVPTHSSTSSTASGFGDGYSWAFVDVYTTVEQQVIQLDNYLIENATTLTTGPQHTQLAIWRDSHIDFQTTYEGQKNKILMAGNVNAGTGTVLEVKGSTDIMSVANTYAGPVTPANTAVAGNINPAHVDMTLATTGTVRSTNDTINTATHSGLTMTGNMPCDSQSAASVGQRPSDLFQGSFTTDGNGNWKLNDADATILRSGATSRAAFIAKVQAVYAPKPGVTAGAF